MSYRRFMGSEPSERHEHYDADGNLTGYTIVTREPEWTDEQRDIALEEARYQRHVHGPCGAHADQALDTTHARVVDHDRHACEDCKAIDGAREKWHREQNHDRDYPKDKGKPCPCADEVFHITQRIPLDSPRLAHVVAAPTPDP